MTGRRSHGRLSALNGVVHQGTRDSTTSSCNDHHLREGRTPTFGGGYASEDYSVSTIERPHEGSTD